jgi:glycolate oxidase
MIKGDLTDEQWNGTYVKEAIKEIFLLCKSLGGTISGEHGIGLIQKEYMSLMFSEKAIELQKSIKKVFDPNNILNPGKIFN